MKKFLLTIVALMGMAFDAFAGLTEDVYCFSMLDDTTYYIPAENAEEIAVAFEDAGGTYSDWSGSGTWLVLTYYSTGEVMYKNDYLTIQSATDYGTVYLNYMSKRSTLEENTGADYSDHGAVNLGGTLSQHIYDGSDGENSATTITFSEEEINALSIARANQTVLAVTPTVAGTLGAKVACSNARSIAIFKVPTLEEYVEEFYEGEWVAINDFASEDGCPAEVYGEVEADQLYWVLASSTNVEMYELTFNPSGEETGISEVAATAKSATDGKIYSLDGRYVSGNGLNSIQKGVYIMNGKKYVVK